jgi:hypothetical protein
MKSFKSLTPRLPQSALSISASFAGAAAITALLGATMLATPFNAAFADSTTTTTTTSTPAPAADAAAPVAAESVEDRISSLHASLGITPNEDAKWNNVAQAMRQNAAAMDKLVAENRMVPPQNTTAMSDLKSYEKFAQAHVNGLRNLIASFGVLYAAMPPAQQHNADSVFQSFGHNTQAHS